MDHSPGYIAPFLSPGLRGPCSACGELVSTTTLAPIIAFGILTVGFLATMLGTAAEPAEVSLHEQAITEELKVPTDPTIFVRRVWLETEWNKHTDDHHDVEETLGGLWAWRVRPDQDWAVRLKIPYRWHVAGDAAADLDDRGFGDLKVATGTAFRLSAPWRAALGLELRTPTAEDGLGDDDWRLQEFGALAWDATPWLTLSPSVEYNQSVAEEHNVPPRHYLESYFPATFLLPHRWAVTPQYEIKVDFEDDNYVTHSAKLVVAKQFDKPPLGFALSLKKPFDSGEKEFQVNLIITYHFR